MIETGVSYFANGWPHHFERDLEDVLAHHCTYIVHCFSEVDLAYARRRTEAFFRRTQEARLGCWADPWAVMGLFGGEQFSAFVARNPDACQILNTGQRVPAACPSADETRLAMKHWIDAAIDLGADTIFWDEPHLYIPNWQELRIPPSSEVFSCFCPRCRGAFQARFKQPMPSVFTPEVRAFREGLLIDFLAEMLCHVKTKGAKNAITLMPLDGNAYESLPWIPIADLPGLDIFGSDPYWYFHRKDCQEFVSAQMKRVVEICVPRDLTSHFWVQGFGVPAGREAELETGINLAVELGTQSVAVWGMHGNSAWDGASQNPELVWEVIGKTFGKLRGLSPLAQTGKPYVSHATLDTQKDQATP